MTDHLPGRPIHTPYLRDSAAAVFRFLQISSAYLQPILRTSRRVYRIVIGVNNRWPDGPADTLRRGYRTACVPWTQCQGEGEKEQVMSTRSATTIRDGQVHGANGSTVRKPEGGSIMEMQTHTKAGGTLNHNQTLVQAQAPTAGLKVKTHVKAGFFRFKIVRIIW